MPKRSLATFAASTWVLGALGGLVILGISAFIWEGAGSDLRVSRTEGNSNYRDIAPVVVPSPQPLLTGSNKQTSIAFTETRLNVNSVEPGNDVLVFDYNDDSIDDHSSLSGARSSGSKVRTIADNFRETSTR